jgi:YhcH/YjgK/YiaL family protein
MNDLNEVRKVSESAFRFLSALDPDACRDGHYDLEDGVFANVQTYTTKEKSEGAYEAHRAYIDIQYIVSGSEVIAVESLDAMRKGKCIKQYGESGDIELYEGNGSGKEYLLEPGNFLILYPKDAHMPGICEGMPEKVQKAVVKVPCS